MSAVAELYVSCRLLWPNLIIDNLKTWLILAFYYDVRCLQFLNVMPLSPWSLLTVCYMCRSIIFSALFLISLIILLPGHRARKDGLSVCVWLELIVLLVWLALCIDCSLMPRPPPPPPCPRALSTPVSPFAQPWPGPHPTPANTKSPPSLFLRLPSLQDEIEWSETSSPSILMCVADYPPTTVQPAIADSFRVYLVYLFAQSSCIWPPKTASGKDRRLFGDCHMRASGQMETLTRWAFPIHIALSSAAFGWFWLLWLYKIVAGSHHL